MASDIARLDTMMEGGLTDNEITEFKQAALKSTSEFRQQYALPVTKVAAQVEPSSPLVRLAQGFRSDIDSSDARQSHISVDQRMAGIYNLWDQAMADIKQCGLCDEASQKVTLRAKEIFAKNIEQNNFPEILKVTELSQSQPLMDVAERAYTRT